MCQRGGPEAHGPSSSAVPESHRAGGAAGAGEDQSPGPGGPLPRQGRPAAQPQPAAAAGVQRDAGSAWNCWFSMTQSAESAFHCSLCVFL